VASVRGGVGEDLAAALVEVGELGGGELGGGFGSFLLELGELLRGEPGHQLPALLDELLELFASELAVHGEHPFDEVGQLVGGRAGAGERTEDGEDGLAQLLAGGDPLLDLVQLAPEQSPGIRAAPVEQLGDLGQRQPEAAQGQDLVQAADLGRAVAPVPAQPPRARAGRAGRSGAGRDLG
jgi:hypothetical protein